ncbi:hypothetical protein DPX16_3377 [Anabarilius grahami]|uniref:Uncharacterized protein n=1 Tax=Anabarilius grahami TaxID=495550 RepID=A0A3N0XLG9_ANAGA|nr:hypothetical protein DPX16_3377 [Anabarilius grahami]
MEARVEVIALWDTICKCTVVVYCTFWHIELYRKVICYSSCIKIRISPVGHSFPLSKCNCLIIRTGERNRIPSRFRQTQRDNNSPRNVIVEFSVYSTASPSLISPSRHQPASDLWASPVRRVEIHADRPAVQRLSWLTVNCHAALHSSPPACATPSTPVSVSPELLSVLTDFSRVEFYILMSIAQSDRQDS